VEATQLLRTEPTTVVHCLKMPDIDLVGNDPSPQTLNERHGLGEVLRGGRG
jgi:hypothetical protein